MVKYGPLICGEEMRLAVATRKANKQKPREEERLRRQIKRGVRADQGIGLKQRAERERLERLQISSQLLPQLRKLFTLRQQQVQELGLRRALEREDHILGGLLLAEEVQTSGQGFRAALDETYDILDRLHEIKLALMGPAVASAYSDSFMAGFDHQELVRLATTLREHADQIVSQAQDISAKAQKWHDH